MSKGLTILENRGYLTEDNEHNFVGFNVPVKLRKYKVQVDGSMNAKVFWSEFVELSPAKYHREISKKYPDAMIIKTVYK